MFSLIQETFADINKRIEATRPKDSKTAKQTHVLLKEICATMSDRTSTQKLLNQKIEDWINDVIPQIEAAVPHLEDADHEVLVKLQNYYCGIHHLVHFADVMSTAANEASCPSSKLQEGSV